MSTYLKWLLYLPASLAFDIVGRLLAPVVVLFADEDGWLPSWLWWWQTPDNSIDGDAGHLARWGTSTAPLATYVRRLAWLWRNCGYGFNVDVIGFHHQDGDTKQVFGDPTVGDTSGVSGVCRWRVFREGKLVCACASVRGGKFGAIRGLVLSMDSTGCISTRSRVLAVSNDGLFFEGKNDGGRGKNQRGGG